MAGGQTKSIKLDPTIVALGEYDRPETPDWEEGKIITKVPPKPVEEPATSVVGSFQKHLKQEERAFWCHFLASGQHRAYFAELKK